MDATIYVIFKVQFYFALEVWFCIYISIFVYEIKIFMQTLTVLYDFVSQK